MSNNLVRVTIFFVSALLSITATAQQSDTPLQVAFMPDIHFHDIYADLSGDGFLGIPNDKGDKKATIRTMAAQLHSTRLFNENYFALLAAIDDAVQSGISYIALPGDFSDDGQPLHLEKLTKILDAYTEQHGVQFFATPGNHDPVRPFDTPGGKTDFLQADGSAISVQSPGTSACQNNRGRQSGNLICTPGIRHLGYKGVTRAMKNAGLFPQPQYLYWETPFSEYSPDNYSYRKAHTGSAMAKRHYTACPAERDKKNLCAKIPDTSYLVEPVEGLWLLAIDANVYEPQIVQSRAPRQFSGSGNAGYNAVVADKGYLLGWIEKVAQQAKRRGKRLISFSHFPMVDFYDQQAPAIEMLFGKKAFQLQRLPYITTSERLSQTGLKLHVSGHMHMNDTGVYRDSAGHTLFNIQAPSLAAYPPAYKVLTLLPDNQVNVKTVRINHVPRFDELFPHYQREHEYLRQHQPNKVWNRDILTAKNYNDYTQRHLRELVRLRFLPREWPAGLSEIFSNSSLEDLVTLGQLPGELQWSPSAAAIADLKGEKVWNLAQKKAKTLESSTAKQRKYFAKISGFDLIVDLYMLRNGGHLAQQDIGVERLNGYRILSQIYLNAMPPENKTPPKPQSLAHYQQSVSSVLEILMGFIDSEPDNNFIIDLSSGQLSTLTPAKSAP